MHRVEFEITLDVLEPLHGVASSRLQTKYLDAPFLFVGLERLGVVGFLDQDPGQGGCTFERQFRARTDREVSRCRGITKEHDVLVVPGLAQYMGKTNPGRPTDVVSIGHQRVAVEVVGKHLFAQRNTFVLAQVSETKVVVGLL